MLFMNAGTFETDPTSNLSETLKFYFKEEKVYSGTAESFGKQWQVGDVVGVFLDLIDRTISKAESLSKRFSCHY